MQPRMSEPELRLFESFLRCADRYVEFGAGGSTCRAASLVRSSVLALDSSRQWLDSIAQYCANNALRLKPTLIHVDVGPTGDWGYPTDPGTRNSWPRYHGEIWANPIVENTDLFLVDGRFRVACFLQIIINASDDALIMFHDFRSRANYHAVYQVGREVATTEDLSVFMPARGASRARARELLSSYEFERS